MSASSPRRRKSPRAEGPGELPGTGGPTPHVASRRPLDADEWAAHVLGEKPVGYIIQNLERAYGVPQNKWTGWDVLDMLVSVILSQATSDANSDRTYDALKRRFPNWDAVLRARERTLADAIRLGGLANQKAAVIRRLLREIKAGVAVEQDFHLE